jgi:predicted secreted protein
MQGGCIPVTNSQQSIQNSLGNNLLSIWNLTHKFFIRQFFQIRSYSVTLFVINSLQEEDNLTGDKRIRKKIVIVLFLSTIWLVFALALTSEGLCNGSILTGDDMNNRKTIIIRKQDNGKEIKVKCGSVVQIELEQLGSAGYSWNIDKVNTDYLVLLSDETAAGTESKIGASVLRKWRFKTIKKGSVEIKMNYYRKWEGIGKATEHFLIKLSID